MLTIVDVMVSFLLNLCLNILLETCMLLKKFVSVFDFLIQLGKRLLFV